MIDTGFDKPIGFWLKELDRLIDKHFEMQLSDAGLSRRQWQLLNCLRTIGDLYQACKLSWSHSCNAPKTI